MMFKFFLEITPSLEMLQLLKNFFLSFQLWES